MTVSNTTVKVTVIGNGVQTVFDYSFLVPAKSEAQLILTDANGDETTLDPATWTLTGAGVATGGQFTYPIVGDPIPSPEKLTLIRVSPATQTTRLRNQGPFFQATVEAALDRQALVSQQLSENLGRAFQFPAGESLTGVVPGVLARAGYVLGFSSQVGHEGELTLFASAGGEQGPPGTGGLPAGGSSGQLLYNNGPGSAAWFETADGDFRLTEAALDPPWGSTAVPYLGVIGSGAQPPWRTNAIVADWYLTEIPSTWPGGAGSLVLDLSAITSPMPYGTLVIEGTNGSGGTLEIKLPPTGMMFAGQHLRVMSLRDFTSLTVTANSGQAVASAPTRLDYGAAIDFYWVADASKWIASGSGVAPATVPGTGGVTSVALTAPSVLSVSGSPITTAGTLALSLANQTANTMLLGPSSGAAAAPTFRTLRGDDVSAQWDMAYTGTGAALPGGVLMFGAAGTSVPTYSTQLSIGNGSSLLPPGPLMYYGTSRDPTFGVPAAQPFFRVDASSPGTADTGFRFSNAGSLGPFGHSGSLTYNSAVQPGSPIRFNSIMNSGRITSAAYAGSVTSGSTLDLSAITAGSNISESQVVLNTGSIAAYTVKMPVSGAIVDGQRLRVTFANAVGALTFTPAAGQTILNAPTSATRGASIAFEFRDNGGPLDKTWVRLPGNETTPGGGSVASVALTAPGGGVFAITGSPVTSTGTLAITSSGTVGGQPYFNAAGSIASTGVLTQYGPIIGGGTASAPHSIAVGTSGLPLISAGGTADPSFAALGLSGMASLAAGSVIGNSGTASATPAALTPSQVLDIITSASTQGTILYRGASGWASLAPGTNGQFLQTQGAAANPAWAGRRVSMSFAINGGGLPITTGIKEWFNLADAGTIEQWTVLLADSSGAAVSDSITIDVLCAAYSSYATATSMVGGGTKPNTSAAAKNQAAPASWTTTSIAANSNMAFNVTSAPSTATRATITLWIRLP